MSTPLRHFHLLYRAKQQLYPISHHSLSSNLITSHNISFIISLSSLIPSLLSHPTSQLCHHISFNTSLSSQLLSHLLHQISHYISFMTCNLLHLISNRIHHISHPNSLSLHLSNLISPTHLKSLLTPLVLPRCSTENHMKSFLPVAMPSFNSIDLFHPHQQTQCHHLAMINDQFSTDLT